jgi:hypothetical protein
MSGAYLNDTAQYALLNARIFDFRRSATLLLPSSAERFVELHQRDQFIS